MIIFLHGQDSYSLIQYVNQLIERYQKKYPESFNLHKFDLEEDNPDEIKSVIKGSSFFKEVKFIILRGPFAKSEFLEKVIKESDLKTEKDSVLLLYQTGDQEKLKKSKLFTLLAKTGQVKEFKPPTSQTVSKFASNYLSQNKIPIKKEVLNKLIKETGPDLWRLKNELDKMAFFSKKTNKKEIGENELSELVRFKIDYNIFSLAEAAFSDQGKAVLLFENYLTSGGDPLHLLSIIAFQLKNMLTIRELIDKNYQYGQILKKTKMHPFFFKKNYEAAQKYSLNDLKKFFEKLVEFEINFKTGRAEAENLFFHIFK